MKPAPDYHDANRLLYGFFRGFAWIFGIIGAHFALIGLLVWDAMPFAFAGCLLAMAAALAWLARLTRPAS